jgi:hypothetical protein
LTKSRPDADARGLLPTDYPVHAVARPHWIAILKLPHKATLVIAAVLLALAIADPYPWAWALGVAVAANAFYRWHVWQGERITLTNKRIIRKSGVAETDWSESSLRLDRISGVWVVQTVPGKMLGYANIEVEAPGSHPVTHSLRRIADPQHVYETLRWLVFGDPPPGGGSPGAAPPVPPDPDDDPAGYGAVVHHGRPAARGRPHRPAEEQYATEPLPALPPPRWTKRGRRTP